MIGRPARKRRKQRASDHNRRGPRLGHSPFAGRQSLSAVRPGSPKGWLARRYASRLSMYSRVCRKKVFHLCARGAVGRDGEGENQLHVFEVTQALGGGFAVVKPQIGFDSSVAARCPVANPKGEFGISDCRLRFAISQAQPFPLGLDDQDGETAQKRAELLGQGENRQFRLRHRPAVAVGTPVPRPPAQVSASGTAAPRTQERPLCMSTEAFLPKSQLYSTTLPESSGDSFQAVQGSRSCQNEITRAESERKA